MAGLELEHSREAHDFPAPPDNPPPPPRGESLEHRGALDRDFDPQVGRHFVGTAGNDKINGTRGDDTIDGLGGNDVLFGDLGNDTIHGGTGNDTIDGDVGADVVFGDKGNDLIKGGDGNDTMTGGANNDRVFGGDGHDKLFGGADNDLVDGGTGNDELFGNSGNDILKGGAGSDELTGGAGFDVMTGGADRDTFVFQAVSDSSAKGKADLITDFQAGVDKIDLSGIDANIDMKGNQGFKAIAFDPDHKLGAQEVTAHFDAQLGKTIIEAGVNSVAGADFRIELQGNVDIHAPDFILFNNHA